MAQLQLPGLSTGIDTSAIVQQLMAINRMRLQARQADITEEQEVKSAIGELDTTLSAFKSASSSLANSSQLKSYNATTSDDDVITASANYNATEGNHSIQIKQLATSDRWVHEGFKRTTSYVGEGNLILSYNNEEMVITTTSDTTLDDLVGLINNASGNPGITAGILKYDAGTNQAYHLVLSGQESGSDYQIKINDFNTEVLTADDALLEDGENVTLTTKLKDLDDVFTGAFDDDDTITIDGYGHDGTTPIAQVSFTPNEYTTVGDLIDEINDAFSGIATATLDNGEIKLTADTDGDSDMDITLAFDDGIVTGNATLTLPTFSMTTDGGSESADIATLKASTTFLQTQAARDSLIRVDDYPPSVAETQYLTASVSGATGTYDLTFGGNTATINAGDNIAAINAALSAASITTVTAEAGTSTSLDVAGTIAFNFDASEGDAAMIAIDTTNLTTSGTHIFTEDTSNWISRSTNTVTDVIDGVTLNLQKTTISTDGITYDNVDVTMTRNTETLKEKVEQLLTAYNNVVKFVEDNAEYDPDTKESGPLYGDSLIRMISSTLKSPFSSVASGFTSNDTFIQPSDIGIEFESDGTLKLNANDFDEAISENYLDVLAILGAAKTGESTGTNAAEIKFYGAGTATAGGAYLIEVKYDGTGTTILSARVTESTDTDWSDARDIDLTDPNDVIVNGTTTTITIDYGTNSSNYPEHNLQFDVPTTSTPDQILTATINVKQGFAGELKESLADMLSYDGRIALAKKSSNSSIDRMEEWIVKEEMRLEKVEERLIGKFARLERTLTLIQSQMGMISSMI
ncbi:MAG TPA: hypothetical protein ENH94_03925 [Phycisphaerales bacterium]|nr:hypothetical protein [Phycisphaerales bacterium]